MSRPWYKRKWPYATAASLILGFLAVIIGFVADTAALHGQWWLNSFLLSALLPGAWNLLHATPFFWVVVSVVIFATIMWRKLTVQVTQEPLYGYSAKAKSEAVVLRKLRPYLRSAKADKKYRVEIDKINWSKRLIRSAIVVGLLLLTVIVHGGWMYGKSAATHYIGSGQAEFVVADTENTPSVLGKVVRSRTSMVVINEGDISFNWVPRVASATGAVNVMRKTGDAITNTQLMGETVAYIYDKSSGGGSWTAIRNGINRQNIFGVQTWSGAGERVVNCEFKGKYALNRAFGGMYGRNLTNDIAAANPLFRYNANDVYGYCDDGQPVIVIPGTRLVASTVRTVEQSYGVMVIKGSSSGNPIITHDRDVQPGDFPGPVYPKRLADAQRDSLDWAAGRCWFWQECFGLDTTSVSSQAGNSTNFLLKNQQDGRLYWVTPLKPASTDSQTLVAYSVIPADEMTSGKLNHQRVYVMGDGDVRIVNLDDLENVVIDAVRSADPGFITGDSPGRIVEFLPVSDTKWQVFAEVGGRVKYRIDVSVGARMGTKLFVVDGGEKPTSSDKKATCDDPTTLDNAGIAKCLRALVDELEKRR